MAEVEIAFKVKQKQSKCEKLLKKVGYELFWKAKTRDLYFTKIELSLDMSEQELKFACVRIRNSNGGYSVDNFSVFDNSKPDKFKCDKIKAYEIVEMLLENGYKKVFDTSKTDYVYKKGNSYHQLQNIDGIGLLDYAYDEDIKDLQEEKQFEILSKEMEDIGIELEYKEGIDKLRTLLLGKLCFSKNQNGNYNLINNKQEQTPTNV